MNRSWIRNNGGVGLLLRAMPGMGAFLLPVLMSACQAERVEYHKRPAFYERASAEKLPDEIVLDNGTVIKYQRSQSPGIAGLNGGKTFQIREEHEDGNITLRALLPEHVIANALTCLRNEEYQLLYEQMLASPTRAAYDAEGGGTADGGLQRFADYMSKHRHDLASTLARMASGISTQEVKLTTLGEGVTRCSLRPQIARPFKFRVIEVVQENGGLKLLMIR